MEPILSEHNEEALRSFLNYFKLRSRNFEAQKVVDVSCSRKSTLPDLIFWGDSGIISFLFTGRKIDEHTEFILNALLLSYKDGENIEGNGDIPVLTALASHLKENSEHVDAILRMSRLVIQRNADPTHLSRKSCRMTYTAPDALTIAADAHCVPMVRLFLTYWWPSPVYLLDSWAGRNIVNFKFLFPLVSKFGWPHGKRICSVVSKYVDNVINLKLDEDDKDKWINFKQQIEKREVSSLKQLSRIAVRESIGRSASSGQDFARKLQVLEANHVVPKTVYTYLMMYKA